MQGMLLVVFGAIVLVLLLVKEALDMGARIEYAEGAFPWLARWAANKKWHRILLVSTFLFYGGTLYELLKEPTPPNYIQPDPGASSGIAKVVKENADLTAELAPFTEKEPEGSLRRQTIGLANDLDHYVETRWTNHPNRLCEGPNIPSPTEEQKKAIDECRKYDDETTKYINDNFKSKWIGIVKEYEGKGVKVASLMNDMEQNHPAQNTFFPFWPAPDDGNYASAQAKFRELAYHVDANGNRVEIPPPR